MPPFPVTYQPLPFTTLPPFAYQPSSQFTTMPPSQFTTMPPSQFTTMPPSQFTTIPPPPEMIMMSSYSCVQSPQLLYGYPLPAAQRGDTWMSDFNDRAVERFNSWANNNAGTNEDFPVVENVLGFEPADRTTVENLEIKKADEKLVKHDDRCSVCLEGWEKGDDLKILPCGHYFHPNCADEWLLTNRFCPLCRFELPPSE
ncbi:uncharacterized protein [Spinacia oleracea]|uniref:RING-type domain-containing protein n=1 Tax=Spinacia oleracea TaxID=3562 RepID=A0A9R0JPP8_SPIOL|nr:uncharacterized protein LOC110782191 [Spinacia oleracea]